MVFSEKVRYLSYWALDFLRGKKIRGHLQDLKNYFADSDGYQEIIKARTAAILKHASETTEYYKPFRSCLNLAAFPVVTKKEIRDNYNKFISTQFEKASLSAVYTSGSYGTPLKFLLTQEKMARRLAEIIFFNGWAGYEIGKKHAYINVTHQKTPFQLFLQNEFLMDPTNLNFRWFEQQRQRLLKAGIKIVISYPSVLGALAEYCFTKGDTGEYFTLEGIITVSETLYPSLRERMEEVFGCNVLSRYSTMEFGVLAQECKVGRKHHINQASYIVEILALHEDKPVKPGELGRVIVTDLFSHAMPLIRYETGDLAILSGEDCSCGLKTPIFERIEGRQVECVYDTDDFKVPPFAISASLKNIEGLVQFQFIQKAKGTYTIKICVLPGYRVDEIIREKLYKILGNNALLSIEHVSSIPPLKSGKRPYILSEYQKSW